eukprot:124715_1
MSSKVVTLSCAAILSCFISYKTLYKKSRNFREISRKVLFSINGVTITKGSYLLRYHLPFFLNNYFILQGLSRPNTSICRQLYSSGIQSVIMHFAFNPGRYWLRNFMNMSACIGIARILDGYLLPNTVELYELCVYEPAVRQRIAYFNNLHNILGAELQYIPELMNEILLYADMQNEYKPLVVYLNNDLRRTLVDSSKALQYKFAKEWINQYIQLFNFRSITQKYNIKKNQIAVKYAALPNTKQNIQQRQEDELIAWLDVWTQKLSVFTVRSIWYSKLSISMMAIKCMLQNKYDHGQKIIDIGFVFFCFGREPFYICSSLCFIATHRLYTKYLSFFND